MVQPYDNRSAGDFLLMCDLHMLEKIDRRKQSLNTLSNKQISDRWLFGLCFCHAASSKSTKTCSDKELKYGGIVRLNAHALSPNVVLRKFKEYEIKAHFHFARVSFTFNGKFTEKKS